eukprot:GFUD01002014.1.p1 GENE.GFUD01002014.1~~GFUD01002014.1.p1  ORF type:complete len:839 (+),score=247.20 GFUD01002014.1:322-2517(+)
MVVHYLMVHSDGDGEEKGQLKIERKHVGDLWTTLIQTTAVPIGGKPIIPASISNVEVLLESDRATKLNAKYVNPTKHRDMHIHIIRVPGKSAKVEIVNGARKHDLTFKVGDLDFKHMDGVFDIAVEGTSLGEPIKGTITGTKNDQGQRVKVELEKGNKKLIQLDSKIKIDIPAKAVSSMIKYSLLGGAMQGKLSLKFENFVLTLKNTNSAKETLELTVGVVLGESLTMEAKKNGESMWMYKTSRTTKRTDDVFELTLETDMTLSEKSVVSKFLSEKYPYGAFHTRHNKIHIFVDKKHMNKLAPKFKVEVHLMKDGAKAIDFIADTTTSPYKFKLVAPNFFKRWAIKQSSLDVTVDHQIGKSIVIDTNVYGGIHLEATRGDNAKGGRDIHVLAKKGAQQMFKLDVSTEKINNDNEFKFILHDTFEVNPESIVYKTIISQYKFLTPFNKRSGEFEFYVNKKDKNVLLKKFSFHGKVMKDSTKALEVLITTNEKPYKFELFAPAFLKKEAKISVEHNPGQLLNVVTSFDKFTGFKISKTGSGSERQIEVNGKKLGKGEYTLTDHSFTTKVTLADGNYLEPTITWVGKLPHTKHEAEAFLLENNVHVKVAGSKRNLDLNLNWKMTKPDWNFGTPEHGKISLNAKGHNSRWGDYTLSRDASWNVEHKVIDVSWTGKAQFEMGRLATATPIETEFIFKVLLDKKDLIGKFMKKVNGKEYSIDFPQGSGVMPKIKMGQ